MHDFPGVRGSHRFPSLQLLQISLSWYSAWHPLRSGLSSRPTPAAWHQPKFITVTSCPSPSQRMLALADVGMCSLHQGALTPSVAAALSAPINDRQNTGGRPRCQTWSGILDTASNLCLLGIPSERRVDRATDGGTEIVEMMMMINSSGTLAGYSSTPFTNLKVRTTVDVPGHFISTHLPLKSVLHWVRFI